MGPASPSSGGHVAKGLGTRDSVLLVPPWGAPRDLHDLRHRERELGMRKAVRARGHFPSDQAATKLIWLALRNITAKWERATRQWKEAMNQFAILYEGRFTKALQ